MRRFVEAYVEWFISAVMTGMIVVAASLSYFVSDSGDTAEIFYLTCPWSEDTITWDNIDGGSSCMGAKIGDAPGDIGRGGHSPHKLPRWVRCSFRRFLHRA